MNLQAVRTWWNTTAPVGRLRGHPILVRWTLPLYFLLALAHYASVPEGTSSGLEVSNGALPLIFAASLIAVIVMHVTIHEFAHIAAASRVGLPTGGIVLDPLHGLRPYGRPRRPSEEFVVASSGLVATGLAQVITAVPYGLVLSEAIDVGLVGAELIGQSFAIGNVILLVNILPLFPFDGGSILRSLLVPRVGAVRATQTTASISLVVASSLALIAIPVSVLAGLAVVPIFWIVAAAGFLSGLRAREEAERGSPYLSDLSFSKEALRLRGDGSEDVLLDGDSIAEEESWKSATFDPSRSFAETLEAADRIDEDEDEDEEAQPTSGPVRRYLDALKARRERLTDQREVEIRERVEDLLVKVHEVGMAGLSRDERRFLERASQLYRSDDD